MNYEFFIQTTDGIVSATVSSNSDFSCAPFGWVPYRAISSCECEPEIIDDFWRCIDIVLVENNVKSSNFVRAIRAEIDDKIYGEFITHKLPQS
jgi:hypothetical protein